MRVALCQTAPELLNVQANLEEVITHIQLCKEKGAELIVLASHNGFDVDRKMASRIKGIDVILTGHTHDAIPGVVKVGDTLLIATGSHGKFLGRLDLEVKNKKVINHNYRLMPIFSDAIKPDPEIAALVKKIRAPHESTINKGPVPSCPRARLW